MTTGAHPSSVSSYTVAAYANPEKGISDAQSQRLQNLICLWDEFAGSNSKEFFQIRFFTELVGLNRFQVDFPAKNPILFLRTLERKAVYAFRHEFSREQCLEAFPRLKQFEQG